MPKAGIPWECRHGRQPLPSGAHSQEGVRWIVKKIVQYNMLRAVLETLFTVHSCYFLLLAREVRDGLSGLSVPQSLLKTSEDSMIHSTEAYMLPVDS